MITYSLTDCCHLLGIDPKTLRRWRIQANLSVHHHSCDARIQCLTSDQLLHLSSLHRRILSPTQEHSSSWQEVPESLQSLTVSSASPVTMPVPSLHENELAMKTMVELQTQLLALQQGLLLVTQQLRALQEHQRAGSWSTSQPLPVVEALPQPELDAQTDTAKPQKRTQVIPLIEYATQGTYVIICPVEGQIHVLPDSPEWFAWLASVSSFRFLGPSGRFTASHGHPSSSGVSWRAHRQIRSRSYNQRLGKTQFLTIAALEQAATALQSHLN